MFEMIFLDNNQIYFCAFGPFTCFFTFWLTQISNIHVWKGHFSNVFSSCVATEYLSYLSKFLEAESNSDLQQQVEQLLCEVAPSNDTAHNSWVHCGRTKVFLTQSMVSFRGSLAAPRPARIFLMIHLSFPVSQLDLLEHRRKKILSQCAFTVQCCWLRHQRRKRQTQQRSATLIQAGKVIDVSVFTHCQRLPTF